MIPSVPSPLPSRFEPRSYQIEAKTAVLTEIASGNTRTVVVLPTGTGKTIIMTMLVPELGTPLLVLAHRAEILDQNHRSMILGNPGVLVGVEQAGRRVRGDEEIILASIPTLATKHSRRLAQLQRIPFRAVICDEVHHSTAPSWRHVLQSLRCFEPGGPPLIGFTATPRRGDGVGLQSIFQSIAFQKSLRDMIVAGWLSNLRAWTIQTTTSLDGIRMSGEDKDFALGELAHRVNNPARNALVVEAYTRYAEKRPALVFSTTRIHAQALVETFRNAGYHRTDYVADDLKGDERQRRIRAFQEGRLHILVNITILTEGFDFPRLSCLVLARPTSSPLLYAQMIGRATRTALGKIDALVIDLVDNCTKHRIHSVSNLLGLDIPLKFGGEPVVKTIQQIEDQLVRHPELALHEFIAPQDLLRRAAQIHLEATPVPIVLDLPPEVRQLARLSWYKMGPSKYIILAGDASYVHIVKNVLDGWDVLRMPETTKLMTTSTLRDAFHVAEEHLQKDYPREFTLNLQNAKWHGQRPTAKQEEILRLVNQWDPNLTRGDASRIISGRKIYRMEHPPEATPATPKQEKLLRHLDRWRDGMTKADASTTLQTYYDEPADPGQRVRLQQLGRWHDGMTRGQARDALKGSAGLIGPQPAAQQAP
jgi:ATP-dependent helicase IRC3